jgi:hypothetical protein
MLVKTSQRYTVQVSDNDVDQGYFFARTTKILITLLFLTGVNSIDCNAINFL